MKINFVEKICHLWSYKPFCAFLLLLIFMSSCKEEFSPLITYQVLERSIAQNDTLQYFTTIENFTTHNVEIKEQAKNYTISEVYSDATDFSVFHRYLPNFDFVGKDSVLLESKWYGDDSPDVLRIDRVKVIINVSDGDS